MSTQPQSIEQREEEIRGGEEVDNYRRSVNRYVSKLHEHKYKCNYKGISVKLFQNPLRDSGTSPAFPPEQSGTKFSLLIGQTQFPQLLQFHKLPKYWVPLVLIIDAYQPSSEVVPVATNSQKIKAFSPQITIIKETSVKLLTELTN